MNKIPKNSAKLLSLMIVSLITLASACTKGKNEKITFSSWGSIDEINILKPILADFTKKTGKEVELIHIPDNYFQKLHMMFASDTAPDVIFMNNFTLPVYADSGVLDDLEPMLDKSSKIKKDDFYPQVLEAMKWKGKLYGVPRDISNLLIYYNKDMFDKYKIAYPKKDWTFEDFLQTSKKLTKDTNGDGKSDTYGFSLDKRPLFWLPFIWSEGGDLFNKDLNKFTLGDKESVAGLQFYNDLRNKYHVAPDEKEVGNAKSGQLFSQEKIGMQLSGRWSVPTYRTSLKFKWDVIPFPKGKNGSIVDVDASGWCVSKASDKKESAWQLVEYLASRDSIKNFSSNGLIVPSRKDVAQSKDFLDGKTPENSKAFLDILATGHPTRTTPNWNEISTEIDTGLENIWSSTDSVQTATQNITKRVDALLK
ncbi:MAG: sugar ABC transporter substrate-binding protein [Candidatus Sericytochromatia bacterium]|nr:sugar ABC transporter substrate-binding protein [Candidatus Sericytochromatia bacterium]